MFLLRTVFNILVRNANPRGPICFKCLIFILSGPCELLFMFFYCLLDQRSGECNVVSLYICVALSMDMFVLCVVCLTVFVILLLNVMELLSVVGGALLDRPCMVCHRMYVLCMWSR